MLRKRRPTSTHNGISKGISAKEVRVSVIFTRINDIDTINEKFSCEATVFATWQEDINTIKHYEETTAAVNKNNNNNSEGDSQQQRNLSAKIEDDEKTFYWNPNSYWDPQLYIDNAIGEVKEKDVKYRLETIYDIERCETYLEVNMIKRIQGVFFEKLELYHFPFDVQDLSLQITSHRPASEIYLIQDYKNPSKVTKHASLDKHIWTLHDHINVKVTTVRNDYPLTLNDEADSAYCHSSITFQCRVSRRPGYFVVNCLLPTLMITLCVFFTFLMDYKRYQYRFSLLFTTMLTSVTFRFSIHGRTLPTISYLTFLDMYCVSSIFIVFICMVWHAIYCFIYKTNDKLAVQLDTYAMWSIALIVIIMHCIQFIWFCVAIRKRTKLEMLDRDAIKDHLRLRNSGGEHHILNGVHRRLSANTRVTTATTTSTKNTRKIFFSVGKLQNSSLILFKQYLINNDITQQQQHQQYDPQNTLTSPSFMHNFNENIRFSLGNCINEPHYHQGRRLDVVNSGGSGIAIGGGLRNDSCPHIPLIQQMSKDSNQ